MYFTGYTYIVYFMYMYVIYTMANGRKLSKVTFRIPFHNDFYTGGNYARTSPSSKLGVTMTVASETEGR